jgi:hypothetical protein
LSIVIDEATYTNWTGGSLYPNAIISIRGIDSTTLTSYGPPFDGYTSDINDVYVNGYNLIVNRDVTVINPTNPNSYGKDTSNVNLCYKNFNGANCENETLTFAKSIKPSTILEYVNLFGYSCKNTSENKILGSSGIDILSAYKYFESFTIGTYIYINMEESTNEQYAEFQLKDKEDSTNYFKIKLLKSKKDPLNSLIFQISDSNVFKDSNSVYEFHVLDINLNKKWFYFRFGLNVSVSPAGDVGGSTSENAAFQIFTYDSTAESGAGRIVTYQKFFYIDVKRNDVGIPILRQFPADTNADFNFNINVQCTDFGTNKKSNILFLKNLVLYQEFNFLSFFNTKFITADINDSTDFQYMKMLFYSDFSLDSATDTIDVYYNGASSKMTKSTVNTLFTDVNILSTVIPSKFHRLNIASKGNVFADATAQEIDLTFSNNIAGVAITNNNLNFYDDGTFGMCDSFDLLFWDSFSSSSIQQSCFTFDPTTHTIVNDGKQLELRCNELETNTKSHFKVYYNLCFRNDSQTNSLLAKYDTFYIGNSDIPTPKLRFKFVLNTPLADQFNYSISFYFRSDECNTTSGTDLNILIFSADYRIYVKGTQLIFKYATASEIEIFSNFSCDTFKYNRQYLIVRESDKIYFYIPSLNLIKYADVTAVDSFSEIDFSDANQFYTGTYQKIEFSSIFSFNNVLNNHVAYDRFKNNDYNLAPYYDSIIFDVRLPSIANTSNVFWNSYTKNTYTVKYSDASPFLATEIHEFFTNNRLSGCDKNCHFCTNDLKCTVCHGGFTINATSGKCETGSQYALRLPFYTDNTKVALLAQNATPDI